MDQARRLAHGSRRLEAHPCLNREKENEAVRRHVASFSERNSENVPRSLSDTEIHEHSGLTADASCGNRCQEEIDGAGESRIGCGTRYDFDSVEEGTLHA